MFCDVFVGFVFFFFQAEDGIRDTSVTGVQTCALPIFYMVLLGLFSVGIGWITASLQVYLRDTVQMVSVILTVWFWLTPIFITEDQVPERLQFLIAGNPLAYIVRAYRQALLSYQAPSFEEFGIVAACAAGTFIAGGLFF